jgi:hypothetical protein
VPVQSIAASLSGTVSDEQHTMLPGTTITLTNRDTGQTRTAVSGQTGAYRLVGIPPERVS